ncbi:hypothetical protein RM697_05365 [Ichthyenterobacterium sp. W332]|uniref:Polysaccharide biosynthesis protein n=1 Tax=Microcosmobacter mediterraneus TaxID=3075607 RepID=A0ABU2YJS2_9FLAO|nr:hypothetical protein [Ichthyenterobacterium sp. W332]MDT0558062.1 hypothetical protein [Ichthyenterobacterium sp. W332]
MSKLTQLYSKYLKDKLGLINLFGKVFGRGLFLLLTSFFAYNLSVKDFAGFAIFWSTLRMFTFFSTNNLYIIYFNKVRENLIEHRIWSKTTSVNILFTLVLFSSISFGISIFIFKDFYFSLLLLPTLLFSVIIRNLSEFAKSDNSLYLSIFIEDFLLYFLFFISGIIGIFISNSLFSIVVALLISTTITALACVILFKRKFNIKITSYKINLNDFSIQDFRLGINYTILRGNEFLSNFAVRYLGQIYFGDLFVAYAHIMYQFYNVFTLLTMAVISGLQSKIAIKKTSEFNRIFIKKMYLVILKTIVPFVLGLISIILIFNTQILSIFFPKYVAYNTLLVKVSLVGLVFMLIQPLVFILIYNNKITKIKTLNFTQYLVVFAVYLLPLFIIDISEQFWLIIIMLNFILVQGAYAIVRYNRIE